eukprot:9501527-Pyramimonas_sp.AAC.1
MADQGILGVFGASSNQLHPPPPPPPPSYQLPPPPPPHPQPNVYCADPGVERVKDAKHTHCETRDGVVFQHLESWGPTLMWVPRNVDWLEDGLYAPTTTDGRRKMNNWCINTVIAGKMCGAVGHFSRFYVNE